MHNLAKPSLEDLPTSRQLLRSTFVALIVAVTILVAIVLPAEYAIDPTGVGRVLGLTEMGEVKVQLAEEAATDAGMETARSSVPTDTPTTMPVADPVISVARSEVVSSTEDDAVWRDEMRIMIEPGQGAEVKLSMKAGEQARFSWVAEGGVVNFDTHGNGVGHSISYEKGRGVAADEGVIQAAFDGHHGWFWRNRTAVDVVVVIRTRGQYAHMKRAM